MLSYKLEQAQAHLATMEPEWRNAVDDLAILGIQPVLVCGSVDLPCNHQW
jgi:hypothetical protein